ncbi:MAG: flagellar basal body-associated FliL family protein [Pseudomonadales bacterium]
MCHVWLTLLLAVNLLMTPVAFAQEEEGAETEEVTTSSTRYIDIKPAFVVNYGGVGRLRYLKTEIALRVGGDDKGLRGIRHHMPYIRHTLLMLLSKATEEELSSMEGKELLRQNALDGVRDVLLKEDGEQFIEDLLFNSFIVQR